MKKMTDNPIQNWAKDLNMPSRKKKEKKKDIQMASIHLKDSKTH